VLVKMDFRVCGEI